MTTDNADAALLPLIADHDRMFVRLTELCKVWDAGTHRVEHEALAAETE
ncbi:hypothetical protein [Bradyrhizobium jicamae]|nr:hypothetical protein [Bradyrhizobium jicamae]MBR0937419.1 hypothetical protein [Bradyrhizobium jicamae]